MKKFNKNIVKEFRTGFGRFIAIMAIVALGVGFLIGVMQATPDMKNSMDTYYRNSSIYDVDVKGTIGLTQADIAAIEELDVVESAMPLISTDALVEVGGTEVVGRLIGIENMADYASGSGSNLNRLELIEGEWPDAPGEVVVARSNNYFLETAVGTEIALPEEVTLSNATYGDIYAAKVFKVVGIVSSPDYFYNDAREVTTLGTGVLGAVVFGEMGDLYADLTQAPDNMLGLADAAVFGQLNYFLAAGGSEDRIAYTDCWVKIEGSEGYECFNEGYKNYVSEEAEAISDLAAERTAALSEAIDAGIETLPSFVAGGIEVPEGSWYVLDRASTNVSYISYDMNVEKVEDIAGVFPIFFIVVAALVALTSMTRMVEENRMQIGTFKALGYSNARILSKYLIYCCLASFIGCVAGILIGFSLLPSIFWQAYGSMYTLPALQLAFSPWFAVAVFAIALVGTAAVTVFAGRSSLKERPAKLMQPKAPNPGKRILLERVGFFWNHLKFKWKATVRNIFRYKKNMILTIISVMGCTALILVGFGLNDSIGAVENIQYTEIIRYDAVISYDDSAEGGEQAYLDEFIEGKESVALYAESGQLLMGESGRESIELYVVGADAADTFSSLVELRTRKNSAIIDINSDGLILPENLAIVYGVEPGDTVTYVAASGARHEVPVAAVCEYYTGSVAYMNAAYFSGMEPDADTTPNTLFVRSGVEDTAAEAEKLLADGRVSSVEFTADTLETFSGLSSTMGLVIAVLVISAGALAAIVLYNLININIDERRREIATLRVLGYKRYEVAGYIYRESAILTIVGTLFGLLLGFLLHMFIVGRVDSVMMMFGRAIGGLSYLWAFLLTLAFAAIVYAFMLIKLNKINMAESLKSNE